MMRFLYMHLLHIQLYTYAPNIRAAKYVKQLLTDLKAKRDTT